MRCLVDVCILYKQVYEKCTRLCLRNREGQMLFSHGEKIEICKTFKHGSAYLTQLQYIINLLFKIVQPFNAKKTKDNVADSRQRKGKRPKVMT